ncbi:MAG: SLBB domain-containing protein [bacterium]|nr:SLBB domain-containing protein [bacterium]
MRNVIKWVLIGVVLLNSTTLNAQSASLIQSQLEALLNNSSQGTASKPPAQSSESSMFNFKNPEATQNQAEAESELEDQGDNKNKKSESDGKPLLKKPQKLGLIERIFKVEKSPLSFDPFISSLNVDEDGVSIIPEVLEDEPEELTQFGYDIFQRRSLRLSLEQFTMDPTYILGPGDKLAATFWGSLESSVTEEIKKDGTFLIPVIGSIYLAGKTLSEAQSIIRSSLAKKFVNFELSVNLVTMRSMNIFVLGDVVSPGNFDLPANASILHALYASNGPTKVGSLRNINIIRKGKRISRFDLYDYLLRGSANQEVRLQAGDTVFVEPIGKVVKVDGEVKRPAIYEIKQGESINDVLEFSGGVGVTAVRHKVQLDRIIAGTKRTVVDVSTGDKSGIEALQSIKVQDGDSILVYPILERVHNFVVIKGFVERPGRYAYQSGMTIKDLIDTAEGLKKGAYLKRIELFRHFTDDQREVVSVDISNDAGLNTPLSEWDIVTIKSKSQIYGDPIVQVHGAVKQPGEYKLLKNMYASDLVFLAQLKRFANTRLLEVERKMEGHQPILITLDLHDLLENPHTESDILLHDGDNIFVRVDSQSLEERYIELEGEVKFPGKYMARDGESLSDIISRAGGYTNNAFLHGAILTRESARLNETIGQNKVLEDEKKRFVYDQSHLSGLGQDSQTAYQVVLASRREALRMLESRMGDNRGRIVLDLESQNSLSVDNPKNIIVENGDKLIIPTVPQAITLIGGVQNSNSIIFEKGLDANDYIRRVGGFTPYADKGRVYIFKPNGEVASNGHSVNPGDIIYVPEEVKISVNWLQFFTNITSILTNAVTTITLVERL